MQTLSSAVKAALLEVMGDEPMKLVDASGKVRAKMEANGFDFNHWTDGTAPTHVWPRWRVSVYVGAADLAKAGLLTAHGKGAYSRQGEELPDDVADAALDGEGALDDVALADGSAGTVYAFTYPAYAPLGWLKIGSAADFNIRFSQHLKDAKKAAMPELPVAIHVWPVDAPLDYERAVQRILKIRGKSRGNSGTEWFQTTVDEVTAIISFAQGAVIS